MYKKKIPKGDEAEGSTTRSLKTRYFYTLRIISGDEDSCDDYKLESGVTDRETPENRKCRDPQNEKANPKSTILTSRKNSQEILLMPEVNITGKCSFIFMPKRFFCPKFSVDSPPNLSHNLTTPLYRLLKKSFFHFNLSICLSLSDPPPLSCIFLFSHI